MGKKFLFSDCYLCLPFPIFAAPNLYSQIRFASSGMSIGKKSNS